MQGTVPRSSCASPRHSNHSARFTICQVGFVPRNRIRGPFGRILVVVYGVDLCDWFTFYIVLTV